MSSTVNIRNLAFHLFFFAVSGLNTSQFIQDAVLKLPFYILSNSKYKNTFLGLFDTLISEAREKNLYYSSICKGTAKNILYIMLRSLPNTNKNSASNKLYQQDITILNNEFLSIKNLQDLSNRLHVSRYYLSHLFKDYGNISPMQYLTNMRIEYAKIQLISSSKSINQIAEELGYAETSSFIRTFKTKVGVSPIFLKLRLYETIQHLLKQTEIF